MTGLDDDETHVPPALVERGKEPIFDDNGSDAPSLSHKEGGALSSDNSVYNDRRGGGRGRKAAGGKKKKVVPRTVRLPLETEVQEEATYCLCLGWSQT